MGGGKTPERAQKAKKSRGVLKKLPDCKAIEEPKAIYIISPIPRRLYE